MDVRSLYQVRTALGLLDADDESFESIPSGFLCCEEVVVAWVLAVGVRAEDARAHEAACNEGRQRRDLGIEQRIRGRVASNDMYGIRYRVFFAQPVCTSKQL